MAREEDWQEARRRFVDHEDAHRDDPANAGSSTSASVLEQSALGPLGEEFLGLSHDLFTVPPETGVVGVLERVVWRAVSLVPAASMLSVTLRETDGGFSTPVETDPLATRADHIQYETGEGPCVEATATSSTGFAASPDLAHDDRYPRFGPRVVELGLTAVCSTGMFPGGDPPRLGALNYYFTNTADFATVDRNLMLLLAAHAAVAVQAARGLTIEKLRNTQLTEALQSRDVIGQAKGILMERRGVSADKAFDILRNASQDLNIKLRDIAETVAGRRAEL
jgi:GAF domain-containing protein